MAEGILKFNLPEESREFNIASNAAGYHVAIWELLEYLRGQIKYKDIKDHANLEQVRDRFIEELEAQGIASHFD